MAKKKTEKTPIPEIFSSLKEKIKFIKKDKDYLQIGENCFTRTILIRTYPNQVKPGFLDFISYLRDFDPEVMLRRVYTYQPGNFKWNNPMKWKLKRLHANIQENSRQVEGARNAEIKAFKALKRLQEIAQEGGESDIADLWIYITITAPTIDQLKKASVKVEKALKHKDFNFWKLDKEQTPAFIHASPLAPSNSEFLNKYKGRLVDGESAASTFPMTTGGTISDYTGVYGGHRAADGSIVLFNLADPTNIGSQNMVVLGASGEGKSTWMKAMVVGLLLEGYRVFVFDVDGEWKGICANVGGLWVDQSKSSGGNYTDPFRIGPRLHITEDMSEEMKEDIREANMSRLDETNSTIRSSIALMAGLNPEKDNYSELMNAADRAIGEVWDFCGVNKLKMVTWDTPKAKKANLKLWYKILREDKEEDAIALEKKVRKYFVGIMSGMFERAQHIEPEKYPMIVYHVASQVNSQDDQQAGAVKMAMAMNTVWQQVRLERIKAERYTCVVIDEGQRALENQTMSTFVNMISTTIRKWNGLIMLATNKPSVLWAGGGTKGGDGLWQNSPIKVMFYLEQSGLESVAQNGNLPDYIIQEIQTLQGTKNFIIRYKTKGFDRLFLDLPHFEKELYKTQGIKVDLNSQKSS